jgi:murein DD-endopeptidase MepM/ murein hydrolase activator NlpD
MFFTRIWILSVALLLTLYSPSRASSYIRINQHGVVYYYFNNRDAAHRDAVPPEQSTKNAPSLQKVVPSQGPSPCLSLPLASVLVPGCRTSGAAPDADLFSSGTEPGLPTTATNAAAPESSDSQEETTPAKPSFLNFLTKLRFFESPGVPAGDQDFLFSDEHFIVPDVWARVPKYFQLPSRNSQWSSAPPVGVSLPKLPPLPRYAYQPRLWGRVVPSPGNLKPSSSLYYCFPVARDFTFRDTWGDPRPGGRTHRATDIFAPEGMELFAITSGVIHSLSTSSTGGIMLMLAGNDGHGYGYMHLQRYADGIVVGKPVRAGELVGYVGHTGTQTSPPHLHIQVYPDHQFSHETLVDPYQFLVQLCRGSGVSDLNQPRVARQPDANRLKIARPADSLLNNRKHKIKWIQVYQRPWPKGSGERTLQLDLKGSSVLVIRNN